MIVTGIVLMVPMAVLTIVQYLSLVDLRDKTTVVAEETLKQAMTAYARAIEESRRVRFIDLPSP